ncbi:DNA-binding protein [Sinimarinibacterium sp. CAU 1509]|uniref:DNA-binding protein n=1 Tax=Sinimarinibacterium sp. CAU 1509 TaxID=2562283 RepID=UPI0010AB7515|nr:DNA-binding protein [Sinimarinibacterium sp. CAU 1509]TJY57150.1 DNA-binding protein [Sinimarinibacterium sp. CAU 1509]
MPIAPSAHEVLFQDRDATGRAQTVDDEAYIRAALTRFHVDPQGPSQFRQPPSLDLASGVSATERSALAAVGMLPDAKTQADAEAARAEALHVFFHIFQQALTTREAAEMMGVDQSRIRQRVRERSLLALSADGETRLPQQQFQDNAPIPGLRTVLQALPDGYDPLEVLSWLATPTPDLLGADETPVSPREYLLKTGDEHAVAAIARGLQRGEAG